MCGSCRRTCSGVASRMCGSCRRTCSGVASRMCGSCRRTGSGVASRMCVSANERYCPTPPHPTPSNQNLCVLLDGKKSVNLNLSWTSEIQLQTSETRAAVSLRGSSIEWLGDFSGLRGTWRYLSLIKAQESYRKLTHLQHCPITSRFVFQRLDQQK